MAFKKFMINGEVIFDADSNELKSIIGNEECIMLNAPTARCLQLLLERRDQVISREVFLEEVWRSRGIVVSENTFYQNISLLRKSLIKVGITEDIIVTIRQKGFIISESSNVTPIAHEKTEYSLSTYHEQIEDDASEILSTNNFKGEIKNRETFNTFRLSKWILIACFILIIIDIFTLFFK
ncbi:CadC family transcriptional regulator [Enterobacter sp. MF024]|uniref:transcriptional regulator n=1 Tax=Enterobacter sp. MF024 TaxID=2555644 RepID=UPI001105F23E|nr:winged helix-turn-helix domain-containing protein [Enterobacter sp. MF024]TLU67878.1 CadC family transcriptional regulator [Enterobacter sp. MF024]